MNPLIPIITALPALAFLVASGYTLLQTFFAASSFSHWYGSIDWLGWTILSFAAVIYVVGIWAMRRMKDIGHDSTVRVVVGFFFGFGLWITIFTFANHLLDTLTKGGAL